MYSHDKFSNYYISNFTGHIDTKLDRDHFSKNQIALSKNFFALIIFSHLRIVPLILYSDIIMLLLLLKENEPPILTFPKLYVTLHEIHGSIC